jgi:hypothetical protein
LIEMANQTEMVTGYCMKCRSKTEFEPDSITETPKGARMAKGSHMAEDGTAHKISAILPRLREEATS